MTEKILISISELATELSKPTGDIITHVRRCWPNHLSINEDSVLTASQETIIRYCASLGA